MQEDIDHRAVALVINTTKMTGRALKSAITKYLAHCRQKAKAPPTGRQTVRELVGQGQGVTNIEITDGNIRSFERVARKYGVDYALKKDREKPRYLVFFNTEPSFIGNIIPGICASLEEKRANGADVSDEMINGLRTGLMGPLAGVGDSLAGGIIYPIGVSIGCSMALNNHSFLGGCS